MLEPMLLLGPKLLLGIDTCGPMGSVALGRVTGSGDGAGVEILGQTELEGRSYSTTLVAAIADLLAAGGFKVQDLGAMAVVSGPGSFTGVRIALAAVKGLAEPAQIPVAVLSRLEVLARKAGAPWSALDAHRGEVFLRMDHPVKELLAGARELAAIDPMPARIAICDDAAAVVLGAAWPAVELVRTVPPNAADALEQGAARVAAGEFADVALLDGHYLRRSDAEIFGETPRA
jgi:tRNA threonylcarbamoyladenosine biosynthesis protein TsaB